MDYQIIATNRKAFHEYFVLDKIEAGVELKGSEVKSLREGRSNLKEGYIQIRGREVFLIGVHISPYSHTGYSGHDPIRDRRLLLNKREILKLKRQLTEKGLTAIPLRLYFKGSWVKLEFGVCKGKRFYDKKETIKERDIKRDLDRELDKHK